MRTLTTPFANHLTKNINLNLMKPFVGYGYCPRVRSDGGTYLS